MFALNLFSEHGYFCKFLFTQNFLCKHARDTVLRLSQLEIIVIRRGEGSWIDTFQ